MFSESKNKTFIYFIQILYNKYLNNVKEKKEKELEIDPAASRLLLLIERLGGAATVAKAMGKHPQLFYNIRDGRSKFSLTTLTEMALAFPGKVDANFIVFGVSSENVPHLTPVSQEKTVESAKASNSDPAAYVLEATIDKLKIKLDQREMTILDLRKEMSQLRADMIELRAESKDWREAYIRYVEQMTGIDKEGSKMESSSQTTARDSNRRNENDKASLIGYRQEKVDRFAKTGDPIVDILRATPGVISFYERI